MRSHIQRWWPMGVAGLGVVVTVGIALIVTVTQRPAVAVLPRPAEPPPQMARGEVIECKSAVSLIADTLLDGLDRSVDGLEVAGMPLVSNPHALSLRVVSLPTLADVVDDLGNLWIAWAAAGDRIGGWDQQHTSQMVLNNLMVKRLAEAGQRDPTAVGPLIVRRILADVPHFRNVCDVVRRVRAGEWAKNPAGWKAACTYNPVAALEREKQSGKSGEVGLKLMTSIQSYQSFIELTVTCGLYVLANTDYKPGIHAAVAVARMKHPRPCRTDAHLLFCADRLMRQFPEGELNKESRKALQKYRALLGVDNVSMLATERWFKFINEAEDIGAVLRSMYPTPEQRMAEARRMGEHHVLSVKWNAMWDPTSHLALMSGADFSRTPVMKLVSPPILDYILTDDEIEALLMAFLAFYDTLGDQCPPVPAAGR
jgi:hypothetical protein